MEYQIVEAADSDTLVARVNDAIGQGWLPLGGVAVTAVHRTWTNERKGYDESDTDWTYSQAMTKGASA